MSISVTEFKHHFDEDLVSSEKSPIVSRIWSTYQRMAHDETREAEVLKWAEATLENVTW